MQGNTKAQRGFTLIELSIVLVIIGLIVGGILVGQDLIRSAELRSVISDIEKFNTAANTFKDKYNCLPGDCANATTFFGASSNCTSLNTPLVSGTCNGNGNGVVEENAAATGVTPDHSERFLFWQHLSLSGLIAGNYSGQLYTDPQVPSSRIANACYGTANPSAGAGSELDTYVFPAALSAPTVFTFGSQYMPSGYHDNGNCVYLAISPSDAYSIDAKIDDGHPDTGNVMTQTAVNVPVSYAPSQFAQNPCFTANPPYAYNLSLSGPWCMLIFKSQF